MNHRRENGRTNRLVSVLAVVATFCGLLRGVTQAQEGIKLTLLPTWGSVRSHSPLCFNASLVLQDNFSGGQLADGRIRLESFVDVNKRGEVITRETVISDVAVSIPVMLAPVDVISEQQNFVVRAELLSDEKTYYLDEHFLKIPSRPHRDLVVAIVGDDTGQRLAVAGLRDDDEGAGIVAVTRLDSYLERNPNLQQGLSVSVNTVPEQDLPTEALRYLGVDVVILPDDQLVRMTKAQLSALATWTRGGGSLAVFVTHPVPAVHQGWINEMAGGNKADIRVLFDSEDRGAVVKSEVPLGFSDIVLAYPGVGRSVVITQPVLSTSPEWRLAVAHLWRARPQARQAILQDTPFHIGQDRYALADSFFQDEPFHPLHTTNAVTLTGLLRPDEIEGVSFTKVCALLAACLLVIVPGDYYGLGLLKQRRWTWVLFPACSMSFAWYTVHLANMQIGTKDYVHGVRIVDVDSALQPVRTTTLEMTFSGTGKTTTRELPHTIEVDLGEGTQVDGNASERFGNQTYYLRDDGYLTSSDVRSGAYRPPDVKDPAVWSGAAPVDAEVSRVLYQWTPRVSRLTTFTQTNQDDQQRLAQFDVQVVDWGAAQRNGARLQEPALVLNPDEVSALQAELLKVSPEATLVVYWRGREQAWGPLDDSNRSTQLRDVLRSLTVINPRGLFALVSQISPTGSAMMEDLLLSDPERADECVAAIIVPEAGGTSYAVYRMILRPDLQLAAQ